MDSKIKECIDNIGKNTQISRVFEFENSSLWYFYKFELEKLLSSVADSKVIKLILKLGFLFKPYFLLRVLSRHLLAKILISNKSDLKRKNDKVMVITYSNYWSKYPTAKFMSKAKGNVGDAFFQNIFQELKDKGHDVVAIDANTSLTLDAKTLIQKQSIEKMWKPIELYLNLVVLKNTFGLLKNYGIKWNEFRNSPAFKKVIGKYCEVSACKLLNFLIQYQTLFVIAYTEMCKIAISCEKPDVILVSCGYCDFGRAAVIAGKQKNVPVLEIQHGVISPSHNGYMYKDYELYPQASDGIKSCVIPDKTLVYGPYHKEVLTKESSYPEDSVIITGQPRYDVFASFPEHYSRKQFSSKYNIPRDHRIILWTTQCHGLSMTENLMNYDTLFSAIQNIDKVTLIIKQHPREGRKYTGLINKYLKKHDLDAIITPKGSDTYEQLFVCDLMITKHSTTAMEAIVLDKTLVILNLEGTPDRVDYVENGVAFGVYDPDSLKTTIEKALEDDGPLKENRKPYIHRYLYKNDGKSTKRVIQVIEDSIEEHDKTQT